MTIPSALTAAVRATQNSTVPTFIRQPSASPSYRFLTQRIRAELDLGHVTLTVESERPEPEWLYPALAQLKHLTTLREDWDSYGGLPPSDEVLVNAARLLSNLLDKDASAPSIVPTPSGGVQLEWQTETDDLEILIGPNAQVSGFRVNRDSGREVELEHTSISNVGLIVAFAGDTR